MTRFTAVIHSSGPDAVDFCEDTYEITAETPEAAIAEARRRFDREILPRWPGLRVEDAFVLPDDADCNDFELCDAIR